MIAALKSFYRSTAIVAGMSSLLVVIFCYWSTGIVASMGFPTFVADHGCVFSPQHDDTHGTWLMTTRRSFWDLVHVYFR